MATQTVKCPDCGHDVVPEWDDYDGDYRCPNDYTPLVNDDGTTLVLGED